MFSASFLARSLALVSIMALLPSLALAGPPANETDEGDIRYYTSDALIDTTFTGKDIVVGRLPDGDANAAGDITGEKMNLTIADGGNVNENNDQNDGYSGLNIFGSSSLDILGGNADRVNAFDSSAVSISGGSAAALYMYGTSYGNISGGIINDLYAYDDSLVEISGGTVYGIFTFGAPTIRISGGDFQGTINALTNGNIDFVGSDLDFVYNGNGFFTITGNVGGQARSYDLVQYSYNGDPDGTPTGFTFNGAAAGAVVVPESSTFALALPALAMIGTVMIRRRKK